MGFAILGISGSAQLEYRLDQPKDLKIDSNLDWDPATAVKINFAIIKATDTMATLDNWTEICHTVESPILMVVFKVYSVINPSR